MLTPEQRASRAARYRQLGEDGTLHELFAEVEESLIDKWKRTFDPLERDNLWRTVQLLGQLLQHLQSGITSGLSQTQLTEISRLVTRR